MKAALKHRVSLSVVALLSIVSLAAIFEVKWNRFQRASSTDKLLISNASGYWSEDSLDWTGDSHEKGYLAWNGSAWYPSIWSDSLISLGFGNHMLRMDTLNDFILGEHDDRITALEDAGVVFENELLIRNSNALVLENTIGTTVSISALVPGDLPLTTVGSSASQSMVQDTVVGPYWLITGNASGSAYGGISYSSNPFKGFSWDTLYFSTLTWTDNSAAGDVTPDVWIGLEGEVTGARGLTEATTALDAIGFRREGADSTWRAFHRSNGTTNVNQLVTGPALGVWAKFSVAVTPSDTYWYINNTLVHSAAFGKRSGAYYYLVSGPNRNTPFSGNWRHRCAGARAVIFGWRKANGIYY